MLRQLAQDPELEMHVFYMSDMSVRGFDDPGFGVRVKWDVPLLGGYKHEFLRKIGDSKVTPLLRPLVIGLEETFRKERLDALWVHGYKHQAAIRALFAGWRMGIPTLVRGESNGHDKNNDGFGCRVRNEVLRRLFQKIDAFLYVGKLNREFYLRKGVSPSKLFFMPYSVDNSFFQNAAREASKSRSELLRELNIPQGSPIILYSAKLLPWKRPLDLLEAYHRLLPEAPVDCTPYLVYVGDGSERERLQQRINFLSLNSVRLVGFKNQSELPRYYEACDVFVLPSEREPWGLAVNEVLNAGKPVVVTDRLGCAPDLVRNGESGFVVPVGDVAALSSRLADLIRDRELRSRMGDAGKQIVSQFSYEQDIFGLKRALTQVCGKLPS
jgi:glycosyltransferase involved in cell wall biosynthesis